MSEPLGYRTVTIIIVRNQELGRKGRKVMADENHVIVLHQSAK